MSYIRSVLRWNWNSDAIDSEGDDSSDVILALICDSDEENASERPNATRSRRSYH